MILRWGERARRELQDAAAFLNGQGGKLGDEFLAEVDHLLLMLRSNPRIGVRAGHGRRVILEHRFRYRIDYRILREEVRIRNNDRGTGVGESRSRRSATLREMRKSAGFILFESRDYRSIVLDPRLEGGARIFV